MDSNLLLCRPGFEPDCAAEMDDLSARAGLAGYARVREGEGWLTWHTPQQDASGLLTGHPPVFARTAWPAAGTFGPLPEDRVSALVAELEHLGPAGEVRLEHADTNEGRSLERFLRRFRGPLEAALRQRDILQPGDGGYCLHLFFQDSRHGWMGRSQRGSAGPWENGIPRLKLAASAPSRSALKIEEACLRLLTPEERADALRHGRDAVDLGAAPGGWSWFLASRGVRVTAVDHGRLAPGLTDEFPVQRVAADAFTWRPSAPVDWLVCDVVDKPARTLALMEKWLRHGWTRRALFNLKLPMKRRHAELSRLLARLEEGLERAGVAAEIRAAHLYHDREEVTVFTGPAPAR